MNREHWKAMLPIIEAFANGEEVEVHDQEEFWINQEYPRFDDHRSRYRIKAKPTYRPFANAAEFEPHRDKWVQRSDGAIQQPGHWKVSAYSDHGVWGSEGEKSIITYSDFFTRRFADGTPCGVKVE